MARTHRLNLGGQFTPLSTGAPTAIRHPFWGTQATAGGRVGLHAGNVYGTKSTSPLTKAQILALPYTREAPLHPPPPEVTAWLNAASWSVVVDFSAFGLSGGANLTVNRSAGASRVNGEDFPSQSADEHEIHWIDPEYEWFFSADSLPGAAHQFSPPSWHLAASPHIRRLGGVPVGSAPGFELSTGVNSISTRSALMVSNHDPGEGEEEYTVDTGIPIGGESEGTYHLTFQESLDSVWVGLTAQMYNQAWYLAKHGVWVLPFGVTAAASKSSACAVLQDSVYNHLSTTGYDEEVAEIVEEEEYSDVEHIRVEPSGMSALSLFPPVTIQVYHRPPIEATVTPVTYYPTWKDFQFAGI